MFLTRLNAVYISRRDAEVLPAEAVCVIYASTYVTLCGLIHKVGCYIYFLAKAQSSQRLWVFWVCYGVFERCAFAKAVWVSFTLRLLMPVVPFVVKMRCAGFSQRRGGFARTVYFLCVCSGCAFAEAGCVIYASPYVF